MFPFSTPLCYNMLNIIFMMPEDDIKNPSATNTGNVGTTNSVPKHCYISYKLIIALLGTPMQAYCEMGCIFYTLLGGCYMKIEKLPSGSYRIRKMYKGKTYTVVTEYKPTQKEALQLLAAEMDNLREARQQLTFRTAAESYIESKENVLSPSTIREYTGTIKRLSPEFNNKNISDITGMDIQREINNLAKDRSPKTVRNYHGFISSVMKTFRPNLIINTTLPQKLKREPYIPTDEDVKRILQAAKETNYEVPIMLACFGLRRSEICALTLDDISGNIITINKAMVLNKNNKWVIKNYPKTEESTRDIWVPDELIELIKQKGCIYSGHPNDITDYLDSLQKKLGMEHFSVHKLRHYYASMSHSLGIPDSYIMKSGGWKSDNILKSVYRHAMKDKESEMQQFAGEYLKELFLS